jgi:hypothetical protein
MVLIIINFKKMCEIKKEEKEKEEKKEEKKRRKSNFNYNNI